MLVAFDGTWAKNEPDDAFDTNVIKFTEVYDQDELIAYWSGPGTRVGWVGKILGGGFGAGGKQRINEAIRQIKNNLGARPLDVVGFSRGAAMAVDLCNQLSKLKIKINVRFLGLFDMVGSFGIPWNLWNMGYDLKLPLNVHVAAHAMAAHEKRLAFKLVRLEWHTQDRGRAQWSKNKIIECWFRGVHSDIGGGNGNIALSCFPLYWMCQQAMIAGVKLKLDVMERCRPNRDHAVAHISETVGLKTAPRLILATDHIHESVQLDKV
jgi:hypothetical protein